MTQQATPSGESDALRARACTGFGSSDSHAVTLNDGRPNPHPSAGQPYQTIGLDDIWRMVQQPPTAAKEKGQWIIPSGYHAYDARSHEAQRAQGDYHFLAADIDQGSPSLEQVVAAVGQALPGAWAMIYATRSATELNRKWRILIPLEKPLIGQQYGPFQASLFDALEFLGLRLDRTLERAGQLVYLPNRGGYYEYIAIGQALLDPHSHPIAQRAEQYLQVQQQLETGNTQRNETSRSPVAAFRRKHSIEEMLSIYGYRRNGYTNHWASPYQTSAGFATVDRGDHWISLSDSDKAAGIGKATANGSRYGDAFDLYAHYQCQGNIEVAMAYARQCLKEQDDNRYGDAKVEHGRQIVRGLSVDGKPFGEDAVNRAAARAAEDAQEIADVVQKLELERNAKLTAEFSGAWQNDVPFDVEPSVWEKLAWNAPGIIGTIVRHQAKQATRQTLTPLLAGAITGVAHIAQGRFVLRNGKFATPPGLGIQLLGGTGSSKGDAPIVFASLRRLLLNSSMYPDPVRRFKSGSAVAKLFGQNPNVTLIHNEAGADRSAQRGDSHYETTIAELTDAMTAFMQGLYISFGAQSDTTAAACPDPCLMAMISSTPETFFATLGQQDAERGWMGRWLTIPVPERYKNKNVMEYLPPHDDIKRWVHKIEAIVPPNEDNANIYQHEISGRRFNILRFDEAAKDHLSKLDDDFDRIALDGQVPPIERAMAKRAVEMISRVAFILGLGCITRPGFNNLIGMDCVSWAEAAVRASINHIAPAVEEGTKDPENTSIMVEQKVRSQFSKLNRDASARKSKGRKVRHSLIGEGIQIQWSALKEAIKGSNRKLDSLTVSKELQAMIDDGVLIETREGSTRWLALATGV